MHHPLSRRIVHGALLWFVVGAAHAQNASVSCDRACLTQALDTYLTAVFKHDPAAAGLSEDHFATEDTVVVHGGEGFWKTASGIGAAQGRYYDPVNETAAFLGLLKRNGQDTITSVRIRVTGRKVSEAEWITGELGMGGNGEADPQGLVRVPPPSDLLPVAKRSSRFMMIALANNYFQANKAHDASWLPNDPDCKRTENGVGQRPATPPAAGAAPAAAQSPVAAGPGCLAGFNGMDQFTTDLALRRFTVIDEEAGMVLGTGIYVRYAGTGRRDNLVSEYFQIRDGRIHGIWSAMHFLPLGAPVTSGWEQRHGIWR